MPIKKAKSFNHQVFQKAYVRLNLSPTNRIIFQRLLGFLLRNNKPFPYSAVKLAEITGFHKRTVFLSLQELERCRLIVRKGHGKNRRFLRGSILCKILSTVQNRLKKDLYNLSATVQLNHQNLTNRAIGPPNKTSLYLKHKEEGKFSRAEMQEIEWYKKNPEIPIKKEHLYLFEYSNP